MLWFTSDFHLGHSKDFLLSRRTASGITELANRILNNIRSCVHEDDDLYILGDLMLEDDEFGLYYLKQLPGRLHIIIGNHDTNRRVALYHEELSNCVEIVYATMVSYMGYHFYLSHYPTFCGHLDGRPLKMDLLCLYGHTHQHSNFYKLPNDDKEYYGMYHVGLDSHDYYPVSVETVISDIREKYSESSHQLSRPVGLNPQDAIQREQTEWKQALRWAQEAVHLEDILLLIHQKQEEKELPPLLTIQDIPLFMKIVVPDLLLFYKNQSKGRKKMERAISRVAVELLKDYISDTISETKENHLSIE